MTPVQEARRLGFLAHVQQRGRTLTFGPEDFTAVVEKITADNPEYEVGMGEHQNVKVHVLPDDIPDNITVGSSLHDEEAQMWYSVESIEGLGSDVKITMKCRSAADQ